MNELNLYIRTDVHLFDAVYWIYNCRIHMKQLSVAKKRKKETKNKIGERDFDELSFDT